MPWIIAVVLQGLLALVGSFAGRALVALGISVVSYTGFSATFGWLKSGALSALNGMGADYVNLLAYMKVGVAINIIFSALLARMVLKGLSSDTLKSWVHR